MDILGIIFGSRSRVKIIRLFLLNPTSTYSSKEVVSAVRVNAREVDKELRVFKRAGLLSERAVFKEVRAKKRVAVLKCRGFYLNLDFVYLKQLEDLLIHGTLLDSQDLLKKFIKAGNIGLVVISGIFVQDRDARIDLLIVGDKIRKGVFNRAITYLESNIGRELKYSLLETGEFNYRLSIGDRLLRDVFDFKHQILLDKIGISQSS